MSGESMTNQLQAEEAILELRKIVKALTGVDPRMGQIIQPIKQLSEEDTTNFLDALFAGKKERANSSDR